MDARGWEKSLIGTVLHSPELMVAAEELLPSDFAGNHQLIWAEMLSLHQHGGLDQRATIEAMRQNRTLEELDGGEQYFTALSLARGTAIEEYVSRVMDAALKRELANIGALITLDAASERMTAQEAADEAERRLLTLRRTRRTESAVPMSELVGVFSTQVDGMLAGDVPPAYVPNITPIRDIVDFVDGKDFVVVAARPGEGKSSLMRYEFVMEARKKNPVLLFNLENGEMEYVRYAISILTGIDSRALRNPKKLTEVELTKYRDTARLLASMPLYVKTMGAPSVREVSRVINQHIARDKIKLIGVDYLQLIRNGNSKRVEDISETTGVLRGVALNYNIPVIGNAQLSRGIEHRGENATPQLSDLRESGSLEQDATMVWFQRFVWNDPTPQQLGQFHQNKDQNGRVLREARAVPVKTHIAKNRNGSVGVTAPYLWEKFSNRFLPLTRLEDRI